MIRIRVKSEHVTVRVGDTKERYASAIHALHVIRVAVVEQGETIEDGPKTEQALASCIARAREELEAAIGDVQSEGKRAVCVVRKADGSAYYQTTDKRHLEVTYRRGVWEDGTCVLNVPQEISTDDAIRFLGYSIAPCDA